MTKENFLTKMFNLVFQSKKENWDKIWKKRIESNHYIELEDKFQIKVYRRTHKKLLEIIPEIKGAHILEVGAGSGYTSMLLLKEGANSITLLDKSKQAIKYAKKLSSKLKLKKIKFLSSNSSNLPFQNNQFDIVHSTGLLEHFHDKMILQILKECRRVLKPKGLASMTIPNFFSPEIIWRIIKNKGKGSERHLSKSKMKKLMKLAGFKNVKFINAHASVAPSFFPFQNWFTKFIDNAIKPLDYLNLCYDYK